MQEKLLKLLLFFLIFLFTSKAQLPPNTTGYTCNKTNPNTKPCQTFILYRAKVPSFIDLATIADLFSVSRLMISKPSNISSPTTPLFDDQPLFVPVSCSCNPTNDSTMMLSYSSISYTIHQGDTFYLLSTQHFQNFTTYQSVQMVNPGLDPLDLRIGDDVIFPIFCKCPDKTQLGNGDSVTYLVSYVIQPFDNPSSIASLFGVSEQSIVEANGGDKLNPSETIFVPVARLPKLSHPVVVSPPAGRPPRNKGERGVVLGLSAGLSVAVALLVLVGGAWGLRERFGGRGSDGNYPMGKRSNNNMNNNKAIIMEEGVNLMAEVSGLLDKYRVFGIEEIEKATDGFDEKCLVHGSVYRGVFDSHVFAIKNMSWNACEELKILQKVNHGNLVKLEGFCIDPLNANCFLIYEFVENGSLDSWLHESRNEKLNWKMRLRIAVDVANGLQYIHEHTIPRVVHKDIKSSNILLDANMRAKIANFGLAKSGCNAITMHIVGTQGYIAPEYLKDGIVSTKMDVFSFGVVLLELISGKQVVDEKGRVLWEEAGQVLEGSGEGAKAKGVRGFMDQTLLEETCSMESLVSVMALAVACLNIDHSKRPSMVDIVYVLCKSDDLFYDISDDTFCGSQVVAR